MSDKKKSGNIVPDITYEESAVVGANKVRGKKVIILDADGNQVTNFGADVSELATSAKQDDIITALKKYSTNAIDDYSVASTTFICKEGASTADWYIMKIDETGDYPVFTHATVVNNPTVLTYGDAFTARATLTFGTYSQAF